MHSIDSPTPAPMSDTVCNAMLDSARSFALRQVGLNPRAIDTVSVRTARLALVDGAVDASHPALRGTRIECLGALLPTSSAAAAVVDSAGDPAAKHATFCASILVGAEEARRADRAATVLGLCRGATLVNCAAVSTPMLTGSMPLPEVAAALAVAVRQALRARCRTIVFGVEIRYPESPSWRHLRDAIAVARAAGAIVVLPAGNRPGTWTETPCTWPEALVVASLASHGGPSGFSVAAGLGARTVFAPGEDIPGAVAGGTVSVRSGTSFAAAMAAGVLALAGMLGPERSVSDTIAGLFPPPRRRLDAGALFASSSMLSVPRETQHAAPIA
ncbi:S8 family serine peptidase [Trinickia sp. LjRoot230]|uniref:S8 family serine peptidase n=1 Tax=Trinickia sp. LjRoot230 TaxID=3342288 RepID=UPI003ECEF902